MPKKSLSKANSSDYREERHPDEQAEEIKHSKKSLMKTNIGDIKEVSEDEEEKSGSPRLKEILEIKKSIKLSFKEVG